MIASFKLTTKGQSVSQIFKFRDMKFRNIEDTRSCCEDGSHLPCSNLKCRSVFQTRTGKCSACGSKIVTWEKFCALHNVDNKSKEGESLLFTTYEEAVDRIGDWCRTQQMLTVGKPTPGNLDDFEASLSNMSTDDRAKVLDLLFGEKTKYSERLMEKLFERSLERKKKLEAADWKSMKIERLSVPEEDVRYIKGCEFVDDSVRVVEGELQLRVKGKWRCYDTTLDLLIGSFTDEEKREIVSVPEIDSQLTLGPEPVSYHPECCKDQRTRWDSGQYQCVNCLKRWPVPGHNTKLGFPVDQLKSSFSLKLLTNEKATVTTMKNARTFRQSFTNLIVSPTKFILGNAYGLVKPVLGFSMKKVAILAIVLGAYSVGYYFHAYTPSPTTIVSTPVDWAVGAYVGGADLFDSTTAIVSSTYDKATTIASNAHEQSAALGEFDANDPKALIARAKMLEVRKQEEELARVAAAKEEKEARQKQLQSMRGALRTEHDRRMIANKKAQEALAMKALESLTDADILKLLKDADEDSAITVNK